MIVGQQLGPQRLMVLVHTSKVVLALTPKPWCHVEKRQVLGQPTERGMDRQFYLLRHADLFATHTPTARGGSFDLDAVDGIGVIPTQLLQPQLVDRIVR